MAQLWYQHLYRTASVPGTCTSIYCTNVLLMNTFITAPISRSRQLGRHATDETYICDGHGASEILHAADCFTYCLNTAEYSAVKMRTPIFPAIPDAVLQDLSLGSDYDGLLYGSNGTAAPLALNASYIRMVWPHLLSKQAFAALRGSVSCSLPIPIKRSHDHKSKYPFLFVDTLGVLINDAALFVHQPRACGELRPIAPH